MLSKVIIRFSNLTKERLKMEKMQENIFEKEFERNKLSIEIN